MSNLDIPMTGLHEFIADLANQHGVAYERTGSLLVPIGMHALYNFTSLCFIYLQGRGLLPSP